MRQARVASEARRVTCALVCVGGWWLWSAGHAWLRQPAPLLLQLPPTMLEEDHKARAQRLQQERQRQLAVSAHGARCCELTQPPPPGWLGNPASRLAVSCSRSAAVRGRRGESPCVRGALAAPAQSQGAGGSGGGALDAQQQEAKAEEEALLDALRQQRKQTADALLMVSLVVHGTKRAIHEEGQVRGERAAR